MKVTIYSKSNCIHCESAKTLLASKNIPYIELKLDEDFTREHLMETFPSARSFPVVVIDGFNIGGFDQLKLKLSEETQSTAKLLNE
jgi:glutaredoxin